jgi:small subunit ribosomal protein S2
MERNGIHIINLYKTVAKLDEASQALKKIAASGRKILFVATKKQAKDIVSESSKKINMPYITERWPGGMLTNFVTIRKAVKKMSSIDRMKQDGTFNSLSKKEKLQIGRLRDKLEKNLGSISNMTRLPGAIFIVDILREKIAVKEAQKLNIPIFAMVDTNCDPRGIDYVIPSNDDASKSISKILEHVGAAVLEGLEERNSSKEKEEDNSKTEDTPAPKQEVKEESETKKEVKKEAKSKEAKESSVAEESKETDDKKTKKAKK